MDPLEFSFSFSEFQKSFNPKELVEKLLPLSQTEDLSNDNEINEWVDMLAIKDSNNITNDNSGWKHKTVLKNIENCRTWSKISFRNQEEKESAKPFAKLNREDYKPMVEGNSKDDEDKIDDVLQKFLRDEREFYCPNYTDKTSINCTDLHFIKCSGKKVFRFYYLDAYEIFADHSKIHLFGKTFCPRSNRYISCTMTVNSMKRTVFVLPRDDYLSGENISTKKWMMLKEFYNEALKPLGITSFNYKFTCRKKYGEFSRDTFLEIEYSATYPQLSQNIEGTTFSEIYGTNSSSFEQFIIGKKLKGPCWLDVVNPTKVNRPNTWSFLEVTCPPENVSLCTTVSRNPPLTLLSLHIISSSSTNDGDDTISVISWALDSNYDDKNDSKVYRTFCVFVINDPKEEKNAFKIFDTFKRTAIRSFRSEKELLIFFVNQFRLADPDIIVGYDLKNQQFNVLLDRLVSFNIEDKCKLSRFRSSVKIKRQLFTGRLMCDMKELTQGFITNRKQNLDNLFENFLNVSIKERTISKDSNITQLVMIATNESRYLLDLAAASHIIPTCMKLTNVCGNILSQTFTGSVSKRCEYLLLHTFNENGFVLPNDNFTDDPETNDILGGLVLEPKIGLFENFVLLMDFQSLYPSIIVEYNMCPSMSGVENTLGVLPNLMKELIEERRTVKERLETFDENSKNRFRLHLYQNVLKLSMNGIYGCLASKNFRFSNPDIAQQIVIKGREILRNNVTLLESKGFDIIYGDTDSMMINTKTKNFNKAQEIANEIKTLINNQYSSLTLNIDTIFEKLLIIRKKKYAGISIEIGRNDELKRKEVYKGESRSDQPIFVSNTSKQVIDYILSDIDFEQKIVEIKSFLRRIKQDLIEHKVPIESFCITKYLTLDPEKYSSQNSYPHLQVAVRCIEKSIVWFKKGDPVTYVMCRDKNDNSQCKKPFHLNELKDCSDMEIDVTYYLYRLIYPIICKITEPAGIPDAEIEDALGLDLPALEMNEIVRSKREPIAFDAKDSFYFKCPKCKAQNCINEKKSAVRTICKNETCRFCPMKEYKNLGNQLVLTLRRFIAKYYKYELKCNNRKCNNVSSSVPLNSTTCTACGEGEIKQTFNEIDLFLQSEYFRNLFDTNKTEASMEEAENHILKVLDDFKEKTEFRTVNLSVIFEHL